MEGQELTIVSGFVVRGGCITLDRVIVEPDEAVSKLLDGKTVFVAPRIVEPVTKTIRMVLERKTNGCHQ